MGFKNPFVCVCSIQQVLLCLAHVCTVTPQGIRACGCVVAWGPGACSTASQVWSVTGGHPGLVSAAGIMLLDKAGATPPSWEHSLDTPLLQSKFEAGAAMSRLRKKVTSFLRGEELLARFVESSALFCSRVEGGACDPRPNVCLYTLAAPCTTSSATCAKQLPW